MDNTSTSKFNVATTSRTAANSSLHKSTTDTVFSPSLSSSHSTRNTNQLRFTSPSPLSTYESMPHQSLSAPSTSEMAQNDTVLLGAHHSNDGNNINSADNDAVLNQSDLTTFESLSLADSLYVDENYTEALDAYTAALTVLRECNRETVLQFRILSHRAATLLNLRRYADALEDAQQAANLLSSPSRRLVGLRPRETEMCIRREGLAAYHLQQYAYAQAALQSACQLAVLNHRDTAFYEEWNAKCEAKIKNNVIAIDSPTHSLASASTDFTQRTQEYRAVTSPRSLKQQQMESKIDSAITKTESSSKSSSAEQFNNKSSSDTTAAPTLINTDKVATVSNFAARPPSMPRYQYYQSDKFVTVVILEANLKPTDVEASFEPQHLTVRVSKGGVEFNVIAGQLYEKIQPDQCRVDVRDEKVLIKLRKLTSSYEWPELLSKDKKPKNTIKTTSAISAVSTSNSNISTSNTSTTTPPVSNKVNNNDDDINKSDTASSDTIESNKSKLARPYASDRDWDSIERAIKAEEENESPQGDEAMNKLFQQIFSNADEDTRRAMIKSYQTSGGTVLSTNWDEVKIKDYEKERVAPKGMEWKTWEGKKLPMEKDD